MKRFGTGPGRSRWLLVFFALSLLLTLLFGFAASGQLGTVTPHFHADAAYAAPAPCPPWNAYIFVGDNGSWALGSQDPQGTYTLVLVAQRKLLGAGYNVIRRPVVQVPDRNGVRRTVDGLATPQQVVDAINDPCMRVLWILAHGDSLENAENRWTWLPALTFVIPKLAPAAVAHIPIGGVVPLAMPDPNHDVNQVVLHACGQWSENALDRIKPVPSPYAAGSTPQGVWRAPFAVTTQIGSWSGETDLAKMIVWEEKHKYPAVKADGTNAPLSGVLPPYNPAADSRCGDGDPFVGCMPSTLGSEFGNQSFNLYLTNSELTQPLLLFGETVTNGCITPSSRTSAGITNPTFEVTMTNDSLLEAYTDPTLFDTSVSQGEVTLNSPGNNTPPQILLAGLKQVVFEPYTLVPLPPVGGTTQLLVSDAPSSSSGGSGPAAPVAALAGGIGAAALLALAAGGWYVRRRVLR